MTLLISQKGQQSTKSYPIERLCIEDPISVSQDKGSCSWGSDTFILEERIPVQGPPHYHVLLWIIDAPIIGIPEHVVTEWIDKNFLPHP